MKVDFIIVKHTTYQDFFLLKIVSITTFKEINELCVQVCITNPQPITRHSSQ